MYELVSPVKFAAIAKYTSQIIMGVGAVLTVPLIVALIFGRTEIAATYGLLVIGLIVLGYAVHRVLPDFDLDWKEALVIAAIIFPLSSLVSAIPFALFSGMAPVDAFFEAVSGITTTGLSVAPADAGPVFLFARSWLQWIGGLGIVLIVLSVPLIHPGTSAIRLYTVHAGEERLRPTVMATAKLLGKVYIAITVIAFIVLLLAGMTPFDAICHALCSVSTGGFSTKADSIAAFPGFAILLATIFAFTMGAMNFALYPRFFEHPKKLLSSVQAQAFFVIVFIGIALLAFTLHNTGSPAAILEAAIFQGFSALSTTGYSTVEIGALSDSAKAVITVLMWIGGSVGSTAGGIKILRIIIIAKVVHILFIRFFLPPEVLTPLKVGNDVIESREVEHILSFVMLYLTVLVISSFIFMLYGFPMNDALFEVSSALGTVGLSTGITGAAMPLVPKCVLIADMLLGRIEIIPLAILLFPRTWIKR